MSRYFPSPAMWRSSHGRHDAARMPMPDVSLPCSVQSETPSQTPSTALSTAHLRQHKGKNKKRKLCESRAKHRQTKYRQIARVDHTDILGNIHELVNFGSLVFFRLKKKYSVVVLKLT